MREQLAAIDPGGNAEEDRHLDRARGVEPAVGVVMELEPALAVVKRNRDCFGAGFLFDLFDLVAQRPLPRTRGVGGARADRLRFCFGHREAYEYATRGSALA